MRSVKTRQLEGLQASKPIYPGTGVICTQCACHTQRRGQHGWFYCDRIVEANAIVKPSEQSCHWFTLGRTTRPTPLVGAEQALCLEFRPHLDGPLVKSGEDWMPVVEFQIRHKLSIAFCSTGYGNQYVPDPLDRTGYVYAPYIVRFPSLEHIRWHTSWWSKLWDWVYRLLAKWPARARR